MKFKCLESGSSGNCYILESDTEALIIETGVSFKEVKKALEFNVRKIIGVIASHSHKDHSGYIHEYERAGIPSFKPYESKMGQVTTYGSFVIKSFPLVHDVPCYGFHIWHPDCGSLLYASDTEYIKYRFKNLNHILVEANYSKEYIDKNRANYVHQITGHMEIKTACKFLEVNDTPSLRNVLLLHLSSDSANAEDFKSKAEKVVACPVYVAKRGREVDLRLVPF